MHILLTDVLTCPRCGPAFGLVVLADRLEGRRVETGRLGCANCRGSYPVEAGVANLRSPGDSPLGLVDGGAAADAERAFRAAALLGAQPMGASVLVIEARGHAAASISSILQETHVVGLSAEAPAPTEGEGTLSRALASGSLPFRNAVFRGVAVLGSPSRELVAEAVRVLIPSGRLVIDRAGADTAASLVETGLELLLDQESVVVAALVGGR